MYNLRRVGCIVTTWKRLGLYARVSTQEQSVDHQIEAVRRWIGDRAAIIEVFSEKESSTKARPVLEELLRRARRREFDAIAVYKFDRFARSARELIMWLDETRDLRIDFLSVNEAFDTSTPMGRAMFTILAALAELERSMISERTKARLAYLRSKGVRLGRPAIHIDMEQARRLVIVNKLSVRQLARALGVSGGTAQKVRLGIVQERRGLRHTRKSGSGAKG